VKKTLKIIAGVVGAAALVAGTAYAAKSYSASSASAAVKDDFENLFIQASANDGNLDKIIRPDSDYRHVDVVKAEPEPRPQPRPFPPPEEIKTQVFEPFAPQTALDIALEKELALRDLQAQRAILQDMLRSRPKITEEKTPSVVVVADEKVPSSRVVVAADEKAPSSVAVATNAVTAAARAELRQKIAAAAQKGKENKEIAAELRSIVSRSARYVGSKTKEAVFYAGGKAVKFGETAATNTANGLAGAAGVAATNYLLTELKKEFAAESEDKKADATAITAAATALQSDHAAHHSLNLTATYPNNLDAQQYQSSMEWAQEMKRANEANSSFQLSVDWMQEMQRANDANSSFLNRSAFDDDSVQLDVSQASTAPNSPLAPPSTPNEEAISEHERKIRKRVRARRSRANSTPNVQVRSGKKTRGSGMKRPRPRSNENQQIVLDNFSSPAWVRNHEEHLEHMGVSAHVRAAITAVIMMLISMGFSGTAHKVAEDTLHQYQPYHQPQSSSFSSMNSLQGSGMKTPEEKAARKEKRLQIWRAVRGPLLALGSFGLGAVAGAYMGPVGEKVVEKVTQTVGQKVIDASTDHHNAKVQQQQTLQEQSQVETGG
jgi:hypothetical protein